MANLLCVTAFLPFNMCFRNIVQECASCEKENLYRRNTNSTGFRQEFGKA